MNVFNVADYYLSKESMTPKKLQKLCYYSQAWSMVFQNKPLMDQEFQAWVHGPVCPELYSEYSDYGWNAIPKKNFDTSKYNENDIAVLDAVWEAYGKYTADQLELFTHNEDPWKKMRDGLEPYQPSKKVIPTSLMKEYYMRVYQENQNE